jgi:hypothetical protein
MPTGQGLADVLSGAAGAPVNRPALEAFVANSQAKNGLVSAQTQDAMIKASQAQEQMAAWDGIKTHLIEMGAPESEASLARDAIVGANNHDPVTALKALATAKLGYGSPESQTAGQQMDKGALAGPVATPANYQMPPGSTLASVPIQQSPQGAAQTAATQALTGLHGAQTDLTEHKNTDPAAFRAQVFGNTPQEGIAAITKAVQEGRLDPTRVNSRTAPILAQMELNNPGTNYNRLHADATLQNNATFQQRANGLEIMPGILQHVTQLGKQLDGGAGYSDIRTVGKFQQFMNGELNDPAYAEYMPVRNDALLRLAYLMRGNGASDMANKTEQEAFAPTLAPYALDAWMKGQLSVLKPMIEKNNRIVHLGEPGQGTQPISAPATATPEPAGPPPLGSTVPTPAGATPPAPAALPSYNSEEEALAAGHKKGDRVKIGGVSGTLQ